MTNQEKYVEALRTLGYKPVPARTRKYIVFKNIGFELTQEFLYLGKNGAIRAGKNIATSIPVSDTWKSNLITRAAGQKEKNEVQL